MFFTTVSRKMVSCLVAVALMLSGVVPVRAADDAQAVEKNANNPGIDTSKGLQQETVSPPVSETKKDGDWGIQNDEGAPREASPPKDAINDDPARSEKRRVGKECRSRW